MLTLKENKCKKIKREQSWEVWGTSRSRITSSRSNFFLIKHFIIITLILPGSESFFIITDNSETMHLFDSRLLQFSIRLSPCVKWCQYVTDSQIPKHVLLEVIGEPGFFHIFKNYYPVITNYCSKYHHILFLNLLHRRL